MRRTIRIAMLGIIMFAGCSEMERPFESIDHFGYYLDNDTIDATENDVNGVWKLILDKPAVIVDNEILTGLFPPAASFPGKISKYISIDNGDLKIYTRYEIISNITEKIQGIGDVVTGYEVKNSITVSDTYSNYYVKINDDRLESNVFKGIEPNRILSILPDCIKLIQKVSESGDFPYEVKEFTRVKKDDWSVILGECHYTSDEDYDLTISEFESILPGNLLHITICSQI